MFGSFDPPVAAPPTQSKFDPRQAKSSPGSWSHRRPVNAYINICIEICIEICACM